MLPNTQRDHFPEAVENGKGWDHIELLGVKEELGSSSERRALFGEMDDDSYKHMLGYVCSISKGQPISYEYGNSRPLVLKVPSTDQKESLMNKTFDAVREILSDDELDDADALRVAGLTLAGAINYIHPYSDGNGRTGRVMQYLIEYGTQRGKEAFGRELYSTIAKLPIFDTDRAGAIYNGPPITLEESLNTQVAEVHKNNQEEPSVGIDWPYERILVFLDMMKGKITVPINKSSVVVHSVSGVSPAPRTVHEPGEIDGLSLYLETYMAMSTVPSRGPDEVPTGANIVKAVKPAKKPEPFLMDFSRIR